MDKCSRILILHNIRSSLNVGAIFRTADAVGVNKIYLTGITPLPINKFGLRDTKISKTALGAENTVEWQSFSDIEELIKDLKKAEYQIIGLEIDERAVDYKSFLASGRIAVLLGEEVGGIAPALRNQCDTLVSIPMYGEKESLNVSVATGVLLYRLFDC